MMKTKRPSASASNHDELPKRAKLTPKLDFLHHASPRKLFELLIEPENFDNFFEHFWEKKPLILHRTDTDCEFKTLFCKDRLLEIVKKEHILYGLDVNVSYYRESIWKKLNPEGKVTADQLQYFFNEKKATAQFHHPQRFQDELWHVLEMLESFFGCLVGSNVYITPGGSQGLAPHYDDVEVFIIQLEGRKHWRLYSAPIALPRESVTGLMETEIGEPTHDFFLEPGDFLYFPRGTIHQADTPADVDVSTHITISTYQRHSWGDFLLSAFPRLIESAMESDVDFRRGLPINFLKSTKLYQCDKLQSVLGLLMKKLSRIGSENAICAEGLTEEFMACRLPPYGVDVSQIQDSTPAGPAPDISSRIRLKHPDHVAFIIKTDDGLEKEDDEGEEEDQEEEGIDEEEEENEDDLGNDDVSVNGEREVECGDKANGKSEKEKELLFVYSSLANSRENHMIRGTEDADLPVITLKFPSYFSEALSQLKTHCDVFVPTSDLSLSSDNEKEKLAQALWSCHLLEVISSPNK